MAKKNCKKCKLEKDRTEFYRLVSPKYKEHWDCRDSYCISCRIKYTNERSRSIKAQCVEYLGGKCKKCGLKTENYEIYDFHHRDPSQKDITISKRRLAFNTLKSELDKCDLVCANCHRIIHYNLGCL